MRYVLTGDSGSLAVVLDEFLFSRGHRRASPPGDVPLWTAPVTGIREPDFRSPEYLAWLREAEWDVFVHAGALVGSTLCARMPREARTCNVTGAAAIAAEVARRGARMVYFATDGEFDPEEYGLDRPVSARTPTNPRTGYGRTKRAGRRLVQAAVPPGDLLSVYPCFGFGGVGDGASCVAELLKCAARVYLRSPLIPLDPRRVKEITPLEWIARATGAAIDRGLSGRLPLASGWRRPYGEVVDLVSEITGVDLHPVWRAELDYKGDLVYDAEEVERAWELTGGRPDVRLALAAEFRRVRGPKLFGLGQHDWRDLSALEAAARAPRGLDLVAEAAERVRRYGAAVPSAFGDTREELGVSLAVNVDDLEPWEGPHPEFDAIMGHLGRVERVLRDDPGSRRAVAYIGFLRETGEEDFCLPLVQYLVRDGEVNAFCYARSLDLAGKLPDDVRVLAQTARVLAQRLDLHPGRVYFFAASGHVYEA